MPLEDWELVSLLLGSGSREKDIYQLSREFLIQLGGLGNLMQVTPGQFPAVKGIGPAKRSILLAVSEIVRRVRLKNLEDNPQPFPLKTILESLQLATCRETRESFYLTNLTPEGQLLRIQPISKGGLHEVGIYKRELVKMVLDDGSGFTLLAHNHPKQACHPSSADLYLYRELVRLLEELEVLCIDHWIFGGGGVYSCRWNRILDWEQWNELDIPEDYRTLLVES